MTRSARRNGGLIALAVLSLSLLGTGVAAAAPKAKADTSAASVVAKAGGTNSQPPMSKADIDAAKAAMAPAATVNSTAQVLFAVVNPDGTLAKNLSAVSATRLTTGTYQVLFTQDITNAAYVASIGLSGSSGASAPGEITVVGRAGAANGIFIQTFDPAGVITDLGFHVGALIP
jgi:hypothetical protein